MKQTCPKDLPPHSHNGIACDGTVTGFYESPQAKRRVYIEPEFKRIAKGPRTAKLYRLEDHAADSLIAAAREAGALRGETKEEFWTRTMPQELLDFLDRFDGMATVYACRAYLKHYDSGDQG